MNKIGLVCDYYKTSDGVCGGVQDMLDVMDKSLGLKQLSYFDVAKTLNLDLQPNQYPWFEFSASCLFTKYLKQYEQMFGEKDETGKIKLKGGVFVVNSIVGIMEELNTPIICHIQDNEFAVKELYEKGFYDIHTFHRLYYGFRILQEKTFEKAKKIVVNPQALRDYGEAYPQFREKMVQIANGVDTEFWKPLENKKELREKYVIPSDKRVAIFNGSLTPIKGWHIIADLIKHYKDLFFICIFKHPIDSHVKSDNVKIFYTIPPQMILELNNCADFAIQPSQVENDSRVLAQAQSCDLPLVTSRVGYFCDVNGPDKEGSRARNDFGMTVTNWSFEGFKEAVDFMLDDLKNERKFYSRDLIFSEHRDMESFKINWQKLIDEVIKL